VNFTFAAGQLRAFDSLFQRLTPPNDGFGLDPAVFRQLSTKRRWPPFSSVRYTADSDSLSLSVW
jgi:hypothetical protein